MLFSVLNLIHNSYQIDGIWIGLFNTIQEVCKERAILKREYMGNLRLSGYVLSKYIVQGIICLIQATLLTTIFLNLLEHTAKGGTIWGSHPGMEIWQNCLKIAEQIPIFWIRRPAAGDSTAEVAAEVHALRNVVSA